MIGRNNVVLRPFFSFYGSKWRAAKYYPEPLDNCPIIEPFAGSAGYSTRWGADREVHLVDLDKTIYDLWTALIFDDVWDNEVALTILRGFWLNHGCVSPAKSPSKWMREGNHKSSFWGPEIIERVKRQIPRIKNWTSWFDGYKDCIDVKATWFIDPPYSGSAGKHYNLNNSGVNYAELAEWCMARKGRIIVCEQEGADWLPFEKFKTMKNTRGTGSKEVMYYRETK